MFKTIRSQLLGLLLSFVCVFIISSVIAFKYIEDLKDELTRITQRIETSYNFVLKDIKITRDFFANETISPDFFITGKSKILDEHYRTCAQIDSAMNELYDLQEKYDYELNGDIVRLKNDFIIYQSLFNDIVRLILKRGFKDYGIEGEMRDHAHALEKYNDEIGLANVLMLRRHEKDFIIRQEDQYISKFKNRMGQITNDMEANNRIPTGVKDSIHSLLTSYSHGFSELVKYEKKTGLKNQSGVKKEIDIIADKMQASFGAIIEEVYQKEQTVLSGMKITFISVWILFILISIAAAQFISLKMSRSVVILKDKITEFIKSDFSKRTILQHKTSVHELDILAGNFSIMEQHIVNQMNALKAVNKELETLIYRASHDLKTPLSSIKGITHLALIEISDPASVKYFSMIDRCWQKLSNIIEELGIVGNIKGDDIQSEKINFDELIGTTISDFQSFDGFDKILFSREMSLKNVFYSDKRLLKIIFHHLIENSVLYSKKESGLSRVRISVRSQKKGMVKISVHDNGVGIKKEFHKKIFQMFFRGTYLPGGTGLGLYIVKNSLEKLQGAISVESEEGEFTTFTVLLPDLMQKRNMMERIIQRREIFETPGSQVLNYI